MWIWPVLHWPSPWTHRRVGNLRSSFFFYEQALYILTLSNAFFTECFSVVIPNTNQEQQQKHRTDELKPVSHSELHSPIQIWSLSKSLFYVTAHTSLLGIIIHFLCKLPANILTDKDSSVDVLLQPSFLFYPAAFFSCMYHSVVAC